MRTAVVVMALAVMMVVVVMGHLHWASDLLVKRRCCLQERSDGAVLVGGYCSHSPLEVA